LDEAARKYGDVSDGKRSGVNLAFGGGGEYVYVLAEAGTSLDVEGNESVS
jgi:hypothetical protein